MPVPEGRSPLPTTFSFTLILAGVSEITVEMADALFEAGCDDSSPWSSEGIVSVAFDREGVSLEDAIMSAIRDVRKAGFATSRIEIEVEDIEDRLDRRDANEALADYEANGAVPWEDAKAELGL